MENPQGSGDWATRVTEIVENLTETIRQYSIKPLGRILRAVGAGVVIGLAGIVAVVVILIAFVRVFDTDVFAGRAWATDFLVAGMFTIAGMFLLRQGLRVWNRHG